MIIKQLLPIKPLRLFDREIRVDSINETSIDSFNDRLPDVICLCLIWLKNHGDPIPAVYKPVVELFEYENLRFSLEDLQAWAYYPRGKDFVFDITIKSFPDIRRHSDETPFINNERFKIVYSRWNYK